MAELSIAYRSFRNSDPPQLIRLWQQAGLGRGAAQNLTNDQSFDFINFAQQYFDPRGLILALDGSTPVGFVHAGFGCLDDESGLAKDRGVVCAIVVHPDCRRQGIGRELVRRAESYLRDNGATHIQAGPSPRHDPFYFGLYGGPQPAGFLDSDPDAAPFFEAVGYEPRAKFAITSRTLAERDPVSFRLSRLRRKWELVLVDRPDPATWWWMTRYGRMDSLYCLLVPKGGGRPAAGVTVMGLDTYALSWGENVIGLTNLWVDEAMRKQGLGQCLLLNVLQRLRQETVTRAMANVPVDDEAAQAVFQSAGFSAIDHGLVLTARATG